MIEQSTTKQAGVIVWDAAHGHVCTCSRTENYNAWGVPTYPSYLYTVELDGAQGVPTDGLWKYNCRACGATVWSAR